MLKIRLKRNGRKRQPSYRIVVMENRTRRDGRPVDQVGHYNPITKELYLNQEKLLKWRKCGAKFTNTVNSLIIMRL
jgi:small subunit ribosomal protein S16